MKVLVVDDDPAICDLLKALLSSKGHQVDTYPDPTATPLYKEREACCPQGPYCADAMLVDYSMPNMNGIEFFKLLEACGCRTITGNRAIITAYGTKDLCRELEQLGVKYFQKPFKFLEIAKWLEDCSGRVAERGGRPN